MPPDPVPPAILAGALATWPLDERFLSEALRRANAAPDTLVTIDVFDTALTRLVDSPADLFAVVERDLRVPLGSLADGYAVRRERAERDARRHLAPGREDLDLDAVLDALLAAHPALRPHRAILVAAELDAEHRLTAATPDLLELCRRLRDAAVPYGFVSDMYLPEPAIASLLRAAGFDGWRFLLVSSATGRTKHSGNQWPVVRDRHPHGPILHVGDDAHADLHTPLAHGIAVLPYLRARSARRTGAPLDPALLPFTLLRRDAVLRARAVLPTPDTVSVPGPDWWRDLGRVLGGLVLASFVRWLEARVRHHRIAELRFLSRDGFLLREAWHAAGAPARTGITDHYLCVSRRTLMLSRGAIDGTPDRVDPFLLAFLSASDGALPVSAALRRAGLDDDPDLSAAVLAEFGDPDAVLRWPDGTTRFQRLLSRHPAAVHRRLLAQHAGLNDYLRDEDLLDPARRIGLVDLGWHAGLQRSLRAVVEHACGAPVFLRGFYYGLWPNALANLWGAGPVEAAFCSPFHAPTVRHRLGAAVGLLEELHTAPHGTVSGYRSEHGRTVPVFADAPAERDQHHRITRHFQDGALDTVRRLFAGERPAGIGLDDLDPAAALSALAAVTLSPEPDELWAFSTVGHCEGFDHDRFRTLVPGGPAPDDETERRHALEAAGWQFGTLCAWLDRAPPEGRAALRAWARFALGPSWDERPLRRFF